MAFGCAACGVFADPDDTRVAFDAARRRAAAVAAPRSCDDGNPCTSDQETLAGGCSHIALTGDDCADGAPCLWQPNCQDGTCLGLSRLWAEEFVFSGKRHDAHDAAELADGALLVIGHAPQTALGLDPERPWQLRLEGHGAGRDGKRPWLPQWLDADGALDPSFDAKTVALAQLPLAPGGPRWLAVGELQRKPVASVDQQVRGMWRVFAAEGPVSAQQLVELPGDTFLTDAATGAGGAVMAVGLHRLGGDGAPDERGLACRAKPDGALHTCLSLPGPLPTPHGGLGAVAAMPGEPERYLAVGKLAATQGFKREADDGTTTTIDKVGDAAGGWLVALDGTPPAVVWHVAAPPVAGWKAGAFYDVAALDDGAMVVAGHLGNPDTGSTNGWASPYGKEGEFWLRKVAAKDGATLAESRWQLPGVAAALGVRGANIAVHVRIDDNGGSGALFTFDDALQLRGRQPLPQITVHRLLALQNGDWLLVGARPLPQANGLTYLLRVGPLGEATCTAGDGCAPTASAACDDGDACTLDRCTASATCQHEALADGLACAAGGTCTAAACKPPSAPAAGTDGGT